MSKKLLILGCAFCALFIILIFSPVSAEQENQGPGQGLSDKGKVISPETVSRVTILAEVIETKAVSIRYGEEGLEKLLEIKRQELPPTLERLENIEDRSVLDLQPSPFAPPLGTNFMGITYTYWYPPDPILAAGPDHIVVVVNSSWAIYTKTGTKLFQTTLGNWFSNVLPGADPFDPKIIYDHHAGRWIILALAGIDTTPSYYLISVSQTSDPTGLWWNWALRADIDGSNPTNNWADYPGLGFDEGSAIYITSNQYLVGGGFQYAKLRILYKSQLYSGAALSWWDFWNWTNENGSKVFTWKPAHTFDSPSVEYLVNTHWSSANWVTLWALTNPLGAPPTLTRQATVSVASYSAPPDAQQLGGPELIATNDCRTQDVQYRNGYAYTAFPVAYNWGSGTVSAIRYLKINTSTNSAVADITYGADGFYYYFPAVYTTSDERVVMVFNRSSSTEYAGCRYVGDFPNDLASAQLKAGEGYYTLGGTPHRWGDYSGIGVDPAQTCRIWMYSEYATTNTNRWGTWVGEVTFGPTPTSVSATSGCKEIQICWSDVWGETSYNIYRDGSYLNSVGADMICYTDDGGLDTSTHCYEVTTMSGCGESPKSFPPVCAKAFSTGDVNGDYAVNVSDVIYLINYLFKGGPAPVTGICADPNCDTQTDVSDVIYLINYLFKGGPPPC